MKYRVRHLTFFFQLILISWMVTLCSCLIWQIISFILPPNEYGCVYVWTTLGSRPAIDLQKKTILAKKIMFSNDLCGYVNKQNCRIWGTENLHTCIEKYFFELFYPKKPCLTFKRCYVPHMMTSISFSNDLNRQR